MPAMARHSLLREAAMRKSRKYRKSSPSVWQHGSAIPGGINFEPLSVPSYGSSHRPIGEGHASLRMRRCQDDDISVVEGAAAILNAQASSSAPALEGDVVKSLSNLRGKRRKKLRIFQLTPSPSARVTGNTILYL